MKKLADGLLYIIPSFGFKYKCVQKISVYLNKPSSAIELGNTMSRLDLLAGPYCLRGPRFLLSSLLFFPGLVISNYVWNYPVISFAP